MPNAIGNILRTVVAFKRAHQKMTCFLQAQGTMTGAREVAAAVRGKRWQRGISNGKEAVGFGGGKDSETG